MGAMQDLIDTNQKLINANEKFVGAFKDLKTHAESVEKERGVLREENERIQKHLDNESELTHHYLNELLKIEIKLTAIQEWIDKYGIYHEEPDGTQTLHCIDVDPWETDKLMAILDPKKEEPVSIDAHTCSRMFPFISVEKQRKTIERVEQTETELAAVQDEK